MRPSYVSSYVSGPPSIHPSRSLLWKLWLCCCVQTCFHCPLPPSWSGWMMTSLYSFMHPSYVPSSVWPASQILSLKPLTILWCTSLFCLSSSSILIRIEIILLIYATTLYTLVCLAIHPSRSLLLKLWLCCGVQACCLCPLPPSWSGLKTFCSFMRPVMCLAVHLSIHPDPFS